MLHAKFPLYITLLLEAQTRSFKLYVSCTVDMMSEASEVSLETALDATNALLKNLSKPNVVCLVVLSRLTFLLILGTSANLWEATDMLQTLQQPRDGRDFRKVL